MLKRTAKLALVLSAAWLSQASASAGEITLFSGQGFQGRELTVRNPVRDLTQLDFNDRAASMVVRSGRWEVCVHADYRECEIVEAGEYAQINRLTGQLSSLREVGGYDERRDGRDNNRGGRWNGGAMDSGVTLFGSTDMRGQSTQVRGDVPNFEQIGFNDRAQSMVITSGTWEFCVHANFRGECRVYGPGEYRNLDRAFYRSISSARMVSDDRDGNRGRGRDRDRRNRDGVELFSTMGFSGERVQVRDEVRNMEQMNFNDRAGSLIVYGGQWEFCQHADFRGQCLTYGPGRYDRLGSLNNQISSMRRVR